MDFVSLISHSAVHFKCSVCEIVKTAVLTLICGDFSTLIHGTCCRKHVSKHQFSSGDQYSFLLSSLTVYVLPQA